MTGPRGSPACSVAEVKRPKQQGLSKVPLDQPALHPPPVVKAPRRPNQPPSPHRLIVAAWPILAPPVRPDVCRRSEHGDILSPQFWKLREHAGTLIENDEHLADYQARDAIKPLQTPDLARLSIPRNTNEGRQPPAVHPPFNQPANAPAPAERRIVATSDRTTPPSRPPNIRPRCA
jgi:hypothetical protein